LHNGEIGSLQPDTPVDFARGAWRMTVTEKGLDARVWCTAQSDGQSGAIDPTSR